MADIEEAKVTFSKSKLQVQWLAKEQLSILQLAEKAGLKPDYGCRSGMCGTCEVKLLKGSVDGPEGDYPVYRGAGLHKCSVRDPPRQRQRLGITNPRRQSQLPQANVAAQPRDERIIS